MKGILFRRHSVLMIARWFLSKNFEITTPTSWADSCLNEMDITDNVNGSALSVTRKWMRFQSANYARDTVMEHSRCNAMNAETMSIWSVRRSLWMSSWRQRTRNNGLYAMDARRRR